MILSRRTRNQKRKDLHEKYAARRAELKAAINKRRTDPSIDINTHMANVFKLHQLPRNSSKVRIRNRCFITSRARAYVGYFGICAFQLRKLALAGMIPGIRSASW